MSAWATRRAGPPGPRARPEDATSRRARPRGSLRIVAGRLRGRSIPCDDRAGLRPTADRVREALFSILGGLEGARVLDLFAGTGALAFEALSRGAREALLVEADPRGAERLRATATTLGLGETVVVRAERLPGALAPIAASEAPFDLILADPPYAGSLGRETLEHPDLARCLAATSVLVIEHAVEEPPGPEAGGLIRVDERRYGSTALSFYRHADEAREDTTPEESSR